MNTYELMIMYKPDLQEAEVKKHIENTKAKIKSLDGEFLSEDYWGMKNLSYEINNLNQAYYTVLQYKLNSIKSSDVSSYLNSESEVVLRHMITNVNTEDE